MTTNRWLAGLASVLLLIASVVSPRVLGRDAAAQGGRYPTFEVDPTYPPALPDGMAFGNVSKVVTDKQDHVWIIHRPRTVKEKKPAPAVVELDANGKFIQGWGGPAAGYDWPDAEHNIFVDHTDHVWISGTSPSGQSVTRDSDDMLLKFTKQGKFVKQFGGRSMNLGSKDPLSVNKPGDLFVHAKTNEVYVADGYGNRRLIVYDATTLAYKRMWGAFGNTPEDEPGHSGGRGGNGGPLAILPADRPPAPADGAKPAPAAPVVLDTTGPGRQQFGEPVHSVAVSNDDMVYVGDRGSRRFQVFTLKGTYQRQLFVNRAGPSGGSVCGFAFSPDPEQEFLYVADYGNSRIVIVDRKKLEIVYQFGSRGAAPGQFQGVHMLATDSKGNLYAAEVAPGARLQKFTFKGMSTSMPQNALTSADLAVKPVQ